MGNRLGLSWKVVMYEDDDGAESTAEVGKYELGKSPFGVLDMAGNVWEWVADWSGFYPAQGNTIPEDPRGPDKSPEARRILRGGSLHDSDPSRVRAAYRNAGYPSYRNRNIGFRCARGPSHPLAL